MNAWVRRSLSASLIAGGFVVLGAGVANADEVGAPDVDRVGQTAQQVTGKVTGATKDVQGSADGVRNTVDGAKSTAEGPVEQVKSKVPAAPEAPTSRQAAPQADVVEQATKTVGSAAPQAQGAVQSATDEVAGVTGQQAEGAVQSTTDKVAGVTGQPIEQPVPLPAPRTEAQRTGQATDLVVPVTSSADRTVPLSVDLGDLGNAATATDVVGTVDGVVNGRLDDHGLAGIASVIGVLDTASTLTAEVPGVATVDGSSTNGATADAVADALVDISNGHVHGFGGLGGSLANLTTLDVDAGDLGYLNTTADVYGWVDAIVEATADLPSGDVYGFVSAAAGLDGVLTVDGELVDLVDLSGVVTSSALVDSFVELTGNLADGELDVVGGVTEMLDATADIDGSVEGVTDVALTPTVSSAFDETLDLLEVS